MMLKNKNLEYRSDSIRSNGALGVLLGALLIVCVAPSHAADTLQQAREKAEVRAIFQVLLAKFSPGDGWKYELSCVFSTSWPKSGDAAKQPRPLISVRDALDPDRKRPELFCDLRDRNRTARAMASKPGRPEAFVKTATTTFGYPVLSDDLSSAKVDHEGWNDLWTADGQGDFVASGRTILLEKKNGRWRIKKMVDSWTAN